MNFVYNSMVKDPPEEPYESEHLVLVPLGIFVD